MEEVNPLIAMEPLPEFIVSVISMISSLARMSEYSHVCSVVGGGHHPCPGSISSTLTAVPELTTGQTLISASNGLVQTTMPYSFPPEILDQIVDHLHDEPAALEACCLVSKSWVPRTRTHLFTRVKFTSELPFGRWVKAFPNPSNSPAHYTRTLTVLDHQATTAVAADVGPWIRAFHNVVHLHLFDRSLSPFHGLSPAIRSLRLDFPHARTSEILDLMCSFPLLEDFSLLLGPGSDTDDRTTLSTLPRLIGSLGLGGTAEGIGNIMRRLLDLQGGLHFTKIALEWMDGTDFKLAVDLISRCSRTVEFLDLAEDLRSTGDHPGVLPSLLILD